MSAPELHLLPGEVAGVIFLGVSLAVFLRTQGRYSVVGWLIGLMAGVSFYVVLIVSHYLNGPIPHVFSSLVSHAILFTLFMAIVIVTQVILRRFRGRDDP